MTMLRHFVAATAALAIAPAMVGTASAQSVPEIPVLGDLLGGSEIPDIDLGGVVVVDLDVPADNGDPVDLTIYINSPTGESVELPGDVTVPLVEALLGAGGGTTPDLPLVGDLPVIGALLDTSGSAPDLPLVGDLPVVGDLLGGGLPTDPAAIPVLGDLIAGGGAGGTPDLPVIGDLLGGGLPTDPATIPVLGDLIAGGGAGGLPVDPTDLLGSLPVGTDTLFAIIPVDLAGLSGGVPSDLTALPIDVTSLLGGAGGLPVDPTSLLGGGAGGLPVDLGSLLDPASLPIDPTSLLGGGAGGLPIDIGTLPVVGELLGGVI